MAAPLLFAPLLADVRHAFTTAPDDFATDAPGRAEALTRVLGPAGLAAVQEARQVHGARVVVAPLAGEEDADGLFSPAGGPPVGVRTADCVSILLAGPPGSGSGVAAVHAGWRGAAAGIVARAVEVARAAGTVFTRAAIGPAIGPCCFEVGDEVVDALAAASPPGTVLPAGRSARGRPHLDLRAVVAAQLRHGGVEAVALVGGCTVCDATAHSYRRDGARSGRMLAAIAP